MDHIELSIDYSGTEEANKGTNNAPIAWHKVTEDKNPKYQTRLDEYLDSHLSIPDVANCDYVTCNSHVHKQQLDQWCGHLIDCCLNSDVCLPRVKLKPQNRPRWREDVQPYKTECIWWHNLWVQQDHPKQGLVYDRMREAKRQYLYANRRNKRKEDQLREERMAEDICNNRSREFFKEVKKSYPKCGIAPSIDDQVESGVIADNFANKYDDLYNSVPSDIDRLQGIYAEIHEKCKFSTGEDRQVTLDDIKETLKYIKSRKADGDKGLISDSFPACQ